MNRLLGTMLLLAPPALGGGCGEGKTCAEWTYNGCCGSLGNQALYARICMTLDGKSRIETRCSGTCER